jgi:hypothetical protein
MIETPGRSLVRPLTQSLTPGVARMLHLAAPAQRGYAGYDAYPATTPFGSGK